MRTLTHLLALSLIVSAGCTGTNGDPAMCHSVECRPPTCCGASCSSSADCCEETVCSLEGRCIPSRCAGCGELGCLVDYGSCSAECAPPARCGETCATDSDCAAGTTCRENVAGETLCYPDACASCGGLTPLCRIAGDCGVECVAPERCGEVCTPGSDCGANASCHSFPDGTSRCVPSGFEDECSLCGSLGCQFWPSSCEVTCQSPDRDAGSPAVRDAGVPAGEDAGAPPSGRDAGGSTTPPGGGPACAACCAPCTRPEDCCPGSTCGRREDTGAQVCIPSECGFCSYGCTFQCP